MQSGGMELDTGRCAVIDLGFGPCMLGGYCLEHAWGPRNRAAKSNLPPLPGAGCVETIRFLSEAIKE